jgi:hypothetical protein
MFDKRVAFAAGLAALCVAPAAGQIRQYTAPGGGREEIESRREAFEEAVAEAEWNAGPLRLDPAFWISDISWVGLRAYLPVGSRTTVAAYALPEYIWWDRREDESRLNQHFGLGSFTYFNRLAVEARVRRDDNFGYATNENFERVTLREDVGELDVEVPLTRSLSIRAEGAFRRYESLAEEAALELFYDDLNRDELGYRGGLRLYVGEELLFGAGAGGYEADFAEEATDYSNSGGFFYGEVRLDRPKLGFWLDVQQNDLEAETGSDFGRFDGTTGDFHLEWRPRDSLGARVYALRALAYSLGVGNASAYVNETYGLGFRIRLGWRLELDSFVETGSHAYETELGGLGQEVDVDGYGASLTAELAHGIQIRIGYRHSRISSGLGLPDREIDELGGSLSLGLGGRSIGWY